MGYGDVLSVTKFGFTAGAGDDLGEALNHAIEALPPYVPNVLGHTAPWAIPVLLIPANVPSAGSSTAPEFSDSDLHELRTPVTVPHDKAVVIVGQGGIGSVGIRNMVPATGGGQSPAPYPISVVRGQRPVRLMNLLLVEAGVIIGADADEHDQATGKGIGVYGCNFVEPPEWAVRAVAPTVVGVEIADTTFRSSRFGDIFIEQPQSDLWLIRNCRFLESYGTNLRLRTTGTRIEDCDFEQRLEPTEADPTAEFVQGLEAPYLHLDVASPEQGGFGAQGDTAVTRCRFGNEQGAGGGVAPTEAVVIGPTGSTAHGAAAGAVSFFQCRFRGDGRRSVHPPHEDTDRTAAIAINTAVTGVSLIGCDIFPDGYAYLVREDAFDAEVPPGADAALVPTIYARTFGNTIFGLVPQQRQAVFSRGGHGWEVLPDERRLRPSSAGRPSVNLLPGSASPAGWHASITAAAFPLTTELSSTVQGVALQRKNPGNKEDATLEQVAAEPVAGPAVVSVWARSANGDQLLIRVRARHAGSPHSLGGGDRFFRLTPSFERYWVQLGDVAAEQPPAVVLGVRASATAYQPHTPRIELWGPQLERGWGPPSPFVPNPAPPADLHAPVTYGGLLLGTAVIAYGSAPPVGGVHAHGDIVVNNLPQLEGPDVIGWVCVEAGDPGRWRPFGSLGPVL